MNNDETLDLLLSRILDRRAAPADWDAFATLAQARAESWPQLLAALRTHQGLAHGLDAELLPADHVELPPQPASASLAVARAASPSLAAERARRRGVGGLGWAAALLLALAWGGSSLRDVQDGSGGQTASPRGTPPTDTAPPLFADAPAAGAPSTLDEGSAPGAASGLLALSEGTDAPRLRDGELPDHTALDVPGNQANGAPFDMPFDRRGSVMGELPLQLVSTSAAPDGSGLDVVYVRPVVERTRVSGVYSLGADDLGRPAPVNVGSAAFLVADNF